MFKGHCFPKEVILQAVYFKLRFSLSYRDVEELLSTRGVTVDHATETYMKVKGEWMFFYRAVDKEGSTVDFLINKKAK